MKRLLRLKLKIASKLLLKKYRPKIIGVTGSIGKSSAKEAIYHLLQKKFKLRKGIKNYNNEIGLPLTIIGVESPANNFFGWLAVLRKVLSLLIFKDKDYPEILILEMGVDHPGDMEYLSSIVKVDVAVVTAVSYSHLEYFGNLQNIKKEKQVLIEKLDQQGLAVLNYDSEPVKEMAELSRAKILSYGLKNSANLQAQDINYNFTRDSYELSGIHFKLNDEGSVVPVFLKNVMSEPAIYAALAAAAVGLYFKMNLVEIAAALSDFSLPPGRMNLLPGIKHSFLIDDTYNSSPEAAISAIDILSKINIDASAHKYAVLGDMLEIGSYTEEGHQLVGQKVCREKIDFLIAVGERARDFIKGAKNAGCGDEHIFYFDRAEEAGHFLQNRIKEGDVLLIKGSQGMRMEKIVKELMAEPEKAAQLIVRQDKEWIS
jgi:UDP-N-acetylmuramoyl-tripeptide--D-alanyl-D-alanine ligase